MIRKTLSHYEITSHLGKGVTLESEIRRVMDRLAAGGVAYPPGYDAELISKYKKEGLRYPRILRKMGEPNIRKHPRYQDILQQQASLLDYGCGTGDDIRCHKQDYLKSGTAQSDDDFLPC